MAIVVEDGTGVVDANSYISVDEVKAFAALRGIALPAADGDIEILLIKAMDFIESYRDEFKGVKTVSDQSLQWPRIGVQVDGYDISEAVIPKVLKDAQCQLATDANTQDLMPTGTGREVIGEKVDVIEVTYATTGNTTVSPDFVKAKALLSPLLSTGGSGFALVTNRV